MATTIIYPVYNNQYQTRVSQRKDLVKFFSEKGALSEQSAVSISPMVWAEIGINPDRDLNAYKHTSYVIKDKEGKY